MSPALFLRIYNIAEYIYTTDPDEWKRDLLRTLPFAWEYTEYHVIKENVREIVEEVNILDFFSELVTLCDKYMKNPDGRKYPFRSALGHTLASKHHEITRQRKQSKNDGKLQGSLDILDRGILVEPENAQVYIDDPFFDMTTTNQETSTLSLLVYNNNLTCEERYIMYNLEVGRSMSEIADLLSITRLSVFNRIKSIRGKYGEQR